MKQQHETFTPPPCRLCGGPAEELPPVDATRKWGIRCRVCNAVMHDHDRGRLWRRWKGKQ